VTIEVCATACVGHNLTITSQKICHFLWFVIRSGGYSHYCQLETAYVQKFIIVNWSMPETLLPWFGYQVILVSEIMNVRMRLQKRLSAQQSQLWSAQPLTSFQSSLCTAVKCGRLNGMDAVLINCTLSNLTLVTAASHISRRDAVILRRPLVTHVLLINIYSLAIANHSATNVNAL